MDQASRDPKVAWKVTIVFTAVIAAAYAFGVYLFPSLIPDMRLSLDFGYAEVGGITASRQIAFLITALFSAAAVLRFGAGLVILGSLLLAGLALCGLGVAVSAWTAAGLLIVLNACAASAWIPMVSLVSRVVDYRHQGKAVGFIASGTNYGLCLNGLLVPVLLPAFGWRSVWLVAGGLALLLSIILWRTLDRASLLSREAADGVSDARDRAVLWRLALQVRYLLVYSIACLGGLAGVPFANYFSAFLRDDLHRSVATAGEGWLAMGVAGAVGGVFFGALGDKAGLRLALAAASGLLSASAIALATASSAATLVMAAGSFGASFFSIFGLLPAYVAKTARAELTPAICGLVEFSLGVGGALGSFLGGLTPYWTGSFRAVYVSAAVLSALMVCVSRLLPTERAQSEAGPATKERSTISTPDRRDI